MRFKGFYYLYLKETKRFLKVWGQTILGPVITSLLFLVVLVVAFGRLNTYTHGVKFMDFLIPGLVMMQVTQSAFANTSSSILMGKLFGNITDILAAPLNSRQIAMAYILSSVTRGFITAVIIMVSCYLLTFSFFSIKITHIFIGLYFIFFASFILGAAGLICGLWSNSVDKMSTITNLVIVPLSFLSGTFYSIKEFPCFIQKIVHCNPMFYMIDGFRYAFTGVADFNILLEGIVLFIVSIILYSVCVFLLRSGYRIKS